MAPRVPLTSARLESRCSVMRDVIGLLFLAGEQLQPFSRCNARVEYASA